MVYLVFYTTGTKFEWMPKEVFKKSAKSVPFTNTLLFSSHREKYILNISRVSQKCKNIKSTHNNAHKTCVYLSRHTHANALEILKSCTKPSICSLWFCCSPVPVCFTHIFHSYIDGTAENRWHEWFDAANPIFVSIWTKRNKEKHINSRVFWISV